MFMHMFVYIYVCIYLRKYLYMYIYICIYICVFMHMHIQGRIHLHIATYMHTYCTYTHTFMKACINCFVYLQVSGVLLVYWHCFFYWFGIGILHSFSLCVATGPATDCGISGV